MLKNWKKFLMKMQIQKKKKSKLRFGKEWLSIKLLLMTLMEKLWKKKHLMILQVSLIKRIAFLEQFYQL
jgi:hypothetical protein